MYDLSRFIKPSCIGMIHSSIVVIGVNGSSTAVIFEESWRFGNLHDNATTLIKPYAIFGANRGEL